MDPTRAGFKSGAGVFTKKAGPAGCQPHDDALARKCVCQIAPGRPEPLPSFTLETGELVIAEHIGIGNPAAGKVVTPLDVWITLHAKG